MDFRKSEEQHPREGDGMVVNVQESIKKITSGPTHKYMRIITRMTQPSRAISKNCFVQFRYSFQGKMFMSDSPGINKELRSAKHWGFCIVIRNSELIPSSLREYRYLTVNEAVR